MADDFLDDLGDLNDLFAGDASLSSPSRWPHLSSGYTNIDNAIVGADQGYRPIGEHVAGERTEVNDGIGEDDDGVFSEAVQNSDDDEDTGFGDGEHVEIASRQYQWKVDHSKGEHKLRGKGPRRPSNSSR